jgi:fluoride exporter
MKLGLFLVGAFIGAPTRYVIDRHFRSLTKFPLGILVVNTAGSFLLGLVIESETNLSIALMGFCGALTTWSAFAMSLHEEFLKEAWSTFLLVLSSHSVLIIAVVSLNN